VICEGQVLSRDKFAWLLLSLLFFLLPSQMNSQTGREGNHEKGGFSLSQEVWKAVIWGHSPDKWDLSLFPVDVKKGAQQYIERYKKFESRLKAPAASNRRDPHYDPIAECVFQAQAGMERSIVSLNRQEVGNEAAAFVLLDPICYEWEGRSECPLQEAHFVEKYLLTFSETRLKPYLVIFLMHRYKSASECIDILSSEEARSHIELKYQEYFTMAKSCNDPFITYLANAIDQAPYAYTDWWLRNSKDR
jgi:hypothetical protein